MTEKESSIRAVDRRTFANDQPPKPDRWPRTARRQERIQAVLARRQPDLAVVLENVHDPHNVSAVLRSSDAVGVLRVHAIYTTEEAPRGVYARTTSGSAAKWVEVARHRSVAECYRCLHDEGFTILASALRTDSSDLYALDLTQHVALVFGNEMRGLSDEAIARSDGTFEIPMRGMVQSLNISTACAVALFEAARQRSLVGEYAESKISNDALEGLTADWLRR